MERLLKGGVNPEEWTGYDGYGNVVCRSDADRRVSSFAYDGSATFQVETRNAKNHLTVTEYYGVDKVPADTGRFGQPKKVTDPNLAEVTFEYDTFGRKTREVRPPVPAPRAGDPYPGYTATLSYHLGGVGVNRTEVLSSAGEWAVSYLDGLGRTYLEKTRGSASLAARTIARQTIFGPTGTTWKRSLPYFDVSGAVPEYLTYRYDALGRVTRETKPDGDEWAYRTSKISRKICRCVAEFSFQLAERTGARVFGGPKYTVSPVYEGMFKEELDDAAARHPGVSYEHGVYLKRTFK